MESKTGWMDFFKAPTFNKDGTKFVYIAPQSQMGTNDSYQHLTLVSMDSGKEIALTSGEFVVLDVLHWDENSNRVFYAATSDGAPYTKHIWSVQVNDTNNRHCLTCNITRSGVPQTYFSAAFSPDGKHAVINNEGPDLPRTDIVRVSPHDSCKWSSF